MAMRKGPWTEEEDTQLVCFVGFFGDRRWDFIARVSGLNRTGKSCRLRWVNYLHPGLKHGRITPQEERLILELHSRWGNRWSRIARKLPGRTDNEVKNYWRTHMRKKAQEEKKKQKQNQEAAASVLSPSSPSSSSSSSSSSLPCYATSSSTCEPRTASNVDAEESRPRDQFDSTASNAGLGQIQDDGSALRGYFLDHMWECDIACDLSCPPAMASPVWEYCSCSLWKMDDEELGF